MNVDAKTLNLAEVLSRQAFPKDSVTVYLDQETAYQMSKLEGDALEALNSRREEDAKRIESERESLIKKAEASKYVFELTDVSRHDRKLAVEEVLEKYPTETTAFGAPKPNPEADDMFANLTWKMHVERIVGPDGSVLEDPSIEDIKMFREYAPDAAISLIEGAISGFAEKAKTGFESIAQEIDFLSKR